MNWNTFIFKINIGLHRGRAYWDPRLKKTISTPDWRRVEEEFIDVVCAPDITAAERLAHIHAVEYGIANDWEGVCVWRVIGEPLKGEDDIDSFLGKWENY